MSTEETQFEVGDVVRIKPDVFSENQFMYEYSGKVGVLAIASLDKYDFDWILPGTMVRLCVHKHEIEPVAPVIDASALQAAWLTKLVWDKHARITELESRLAQAVDALRPLCEVFIGIGDMLDPEEDKEYIDICYNAYLVVTAYDARQAADVPALPAIPPERADALARVQQRYADDKAQVSRVYADGLARVRDAYLRAMNAALNADENGL